MYNINGVRDCRELLEINQQIKLSQTERFRAKTAPDFLNYMRVREYMFLRGSKSNLIIEIGWQAKYWTIVPDLHQ